MDTLFIGTNCIHLVKVDSTNSYLSMAAGNLPEGTVIYADEQLAGRGQKGAVWVSETGKNLTASVLLKPGFLAAGEIFFLNKAVSLAVHATVGTFIDPHRVKIKWPNDILVDNRKIAGILIENQIGAGGVNRSIVGIGININQENFPGEDLSNATSLLREGIRGKTPDGLLSILCRQLERFYLLLKAGRTNVLRNEYLDHLFQRGDEAMYRIDGKIESGRIISVAKDGKLIVEFGEGKRNFDMKEIEFLI